MYKIISESAVLRIADGTSIPLCDANADYKMYLQWLAEGNQPLPADTQPGSIE